MIEFMKSNYYDPYIAQYVHPKKEFKVKLKDADKDFIFDETEADLNKFDKMLNNEITKISNSGVLGKIQLDLNSKVHFYIIVKVHYSIKLLSHGK